MATNKLKLGCGTVIVLLVIIALFVKLFGCGDEKEKPTESSKVTSGKTIVDSKQKDFILKKSGLFFSSIVNPVNSAQSTIFKEKTEAMTNEFLKANNYLLTDWKGRIVTVGLLDEHAYMTGDSKKDKIILLVINAGINKYKDREDNYSIVIEQAQLPKRNLKGIYPNNPLYNKVLNLKEGQLIKFSAKVLRYEEIGNFDLNGKENREFDNEQTFIDVSFISIEPIENEDGNE